MLKYGKIATKYPRIYQYFLQCTAECSVHTLECAAFVCACYSAVMCHFASKVVLCCYVIFDYRSHL